MRPATANSNNATATSKKKKRALLLLLLLLLLLIVAVALWLFLRPRAEDAFFDGAAIVGTLPGKTDAEIQAELNRIVEEGMFNISIAPVITFADGASEGQARIENISANHYHMKVVITLDDSGDTVYESGGIKPGEYIENIKLAKALPKGEYSATATFSAYDTESLTEVGKAAARIAIVVEA